MNDVATITCKARFRLAGLAFTGRASNPLDRYKRFQITVSSSFSGLILAQGKFRFHHGPASARAVREHARVMKV
jgi:hypothetical protein